MGVTPLDAAVDPELRQLYRRPSASANLAFPSASASIAITSLGRAVLPELNSVIGT